jgi:hypothetical protein
MVQNGVERPSRRVDTLAVQLEQLCADVLNRRSQSSFADREDEGSVHHALSFYEVVGELYVPGRFRSLTSDVNHFVDLN